MKKFFLSFPLVGALALTIVLGAAAAEGYTLFGDAQIVSPGNASAHAAEATTTGPNAFGGVDFAVPAGLTVSQVQNLSTDYRFTVGTCGLGSPRFVVRATNGTSTGNINFYLGPPPNYTACPPTVWTNTGNLASPANLVDSSQLPGGTFYDPYAAVLVKYGSYTVTDIFLVADGSEPDGAVRPHAGQRHDLRVRAAADEGRLQERRLRRLRRLERQPRPVQEPGRLRQLLQRSLARIAGGAARVRAAPPGQSASVTCIPIGKWSE